MASLSGGLDSAAREDARLREQATLDSEWAARSGVHAGRDRLSRRPGRPRDSVTHLYTGFVDVGFGLIRCHAVLLRVVRQLATLVELQRTRTLALIPARAAIPPSVTSTACRARAPSSP